MFFLSLHLNNWYIKVFLLCLWGRPISTSYQYPLLTNIQISFFSRSYAKVCVWLVWPICMMCDVLELRHWGHFHDTLVCFLKGEALCWDYKATVLRSSGSPSHCMQDRCPGELCDLAERALHESKTDCIVLIQVG